MKTMLRIGLCKLGLTLSALSHGERLGRLFFTPEQRTQLDRAYSSSTQGKPNSSVLIINGIVQKNGGARTVWINGVAKNSGRNDERTPDAMTITLPGKAQPIKAKVGQNILLDQSLPADSYKLAP